MWGACSLKSRKYHEEVAYSVMLIWTSSPPHHVHYLSQRGNLPLEPRGASLSGQRAATEPMVRIRPGVGTSG